MCALACACVCVCARARARVWELCPRADLWKALALLLSLNALSQASVTSWAGPLWAKWAQRQLASLVQETCLEHGVSRGSAPETGGGRRSPEVDVRATGVT